MNEIIKNRTIKIDNITCEGCEKTIHDSLAMMEGVKEVTTDSSGVFIKYDLKKINLEDIMEKIKELNYNPSAGIFQKMKTGFINFTERNERDNLHAPVHSCCSANCGSSICRL